MEQLIGQYLDRYQVVSLLGEGGMGAVFKAHDPTLQRDVAVKVMHPHLARRPSFQERFLQEARAAARLDHPGIVQVHDFGQTRSYLYIVMELIPGHNLRKLLTDLKAVAPWIVLPEAIQLVRQISLALAYAHQQGVLHRDIKPDNVMFKPIPVENLPYRPVLTDLGLAKLLEGEHLTQQDTSLGTPAYMSPEQALGAETGVRSDVYSTGILLYELAVGRLPFHIRTIAEAIHCHTKEPPPPPRSIRPDLPEAMEQIILKTLEKAPADRFPDATALADALAETLTSLTDKATSTGASLMTQYRKSVAETDPPSTPKTLVQAQDNPEQDRILILSADGSSRTEPIQGTNLTIGRGTDNDLVIDDRRVSQNHARVTFDGTDYRVTDLNSTNGTFLSNRKLSPGTAEVWSPDTPLHVGNVWLHLQRAQQPDAGATAISDATMVDIPSGGAATVATAITGVPSAPSTPPPGRLALTLKTADFSVAPGSMTTATVNLLNRGSVVDQVKVFAEGVPAEWLTTPPPVVQLLPGMQKEIAFIIQIPPSAQKVAGRYPLTIRAISQSDPSQHVQVQGVLTVIQSHSRSLFTSDIAPDSVSAGKLVTVRVENQGSTQQTFTVTWQDPSGTLTFAPPHSQVTVEPGQFELIRSRVGPRRRPIIGGKKEHPFSAQVRAPDGDIHTHEAAVTSSGMMPFWVPPIIVVGLCAVLAAGAWFVSKQVLPTVVPASPTTVALMPSATATRVPPSPRPPTATLPPVTPTSRVIAKLATATMTQESGAVGRIPTHAATPSPTHTGTATPVPLPTDTAVPTSSPTDTVTPAPSPTKTATRRPAPTQTSLPPTATATPQPPALSGHIAFSLYDSTRHYYNVYISNPDGSGRYVLAEHMRQPSFSQDGRLILNGEGGGTDSLWHMKMDGSQRGEVGTHPEDAQPSWSPDSGRIAMSSTQHGDKKSRIYIYNSLTHNQKPQSLMAGSYEAFGRYPTWLLNGQIVFNTCNYWANGGSCGLYIMDSGGSQPAPISNGGTDDVAADDHGDQIVFMSHRDGNWEVYRTTTGGGEQVNLTNNQADDGLPAWSPDGQWIAFLSSRGGGWAIWAMTPDGGNVHKLFDLGGSPGPDWPNERISWGG